MAFDLSNYEEVKDRIPKFWADHPNGSIETEITAHGDGWWAVKARLGREDGRTLATGLAEEHVTIKGVNSTSALENCETSAIGRALANAGYASSGKRPSREEMSKASRGSGEHSAPSSGGRVDAIRAAVIDMGATPWVNAQKFTYPWDDATCDVIEAHLETL